MSGAAGVVITSLYVPGDRPERFDKAVATGAQLVILDLEDAVAPAQKSVARGHVLHWLQRRPADEPPLVEVRVNAGDADDLDGLAGVAGDFGVRLPKVESPDDVDRVADALGRRVRVTALIETALGVEAAFAIARHPDVCSMSIGEADLASDLGTADRAVMDWAQARLQVAVRAAGKPPPVAPVYVAVRDLDGLATDTAAWRARGFVGRTAIHPAQVPVIAAAFRPSAAELAWAGEVLDTVGAGGVATLASGEMVDPAMIGRARWIDALAAATGNPPMES